MFRSVRVRLTFWYVLVFGLLLVGFSVFVYLAISHTIYSRLDQSLGNGAKTATHLFRTEIAENEGDATAAAAETLNELALGDARVAIFQETRLLATNFPGGRTAPIPDSIFKAAEYASQPALTTVDGFGEEGARLAVLRVERDGVEYFVALAQPLHETVEHLESLARVFYLAVPATLLLAGVGGLLLVRKSLAPVASISAQAASIGANNLSQRLEVANPVDELGRLAVVLNDLLARLDQSFDNMRRFTADASHELRTPLSIIRGEAEVALSQDRSAEEYREALAIIHDEARRLSFMVDDMLALARADAGQRPLRVEEFYLNDLIHESVRAAQVLALRKGVALRAESSRDLLFHGDEHMLSRMIRNLLDNAIKYTPSGGVVSITLSAEDSAAKIIVSDTGIGIPAEAAGHIFERFYRVSKSRSRQEGGSGLGLSIAKWVAESHRGRVDLCSEPGRGSTFTVTLPL